MMLSFTIQKGTIEIILKRIRPSIIKFMILQSEQQLITIHVLPNVWTFTKNGIKQNYKIRSVDRT